MYALPAGRHSLIIKAQNAPDFLPVTDRSRTGLSGVVIEGEPTAFAYLLLYSLLHTYGPPPSDIYRVLLHAVWLRRLSLHAYRRGYYCV